jgi:hypothetical protein
MKLDCVVFLNLDRDLRRQSETLRGAIGSDVVDIETAKYEETKCLTTKQIPVAAPGKDSDLDMHHEVTWVPLFHA